jgi:hypothetical protein
MEEVLIVPHEDDFVNGPWGGRGGAGGDAGSETNIVVMKEDIQASAREVEGGRLGS